MNATSFLLGYICGFSFIFLCVFTFSLVLKLRFSDSEVDGNTAGRHTALIPELSFNNPKHSRSLLHANAECTRPGLQGKDVAATSTATTTTRT